MAWLAIAMLCSALAVQPAAIDRITEDEVVRRALQRAPLQDAIEGTVVAEGGRALAANAYPLPQVTYLREQTYGSGGTGEDYLSIAQTIRLGWQHRTRAIARKSRIAAARLEGDASRVQVAADARDRFYELLYRQLRVEALDSWIARIEEMLTIVARREARGDAAVYDRKRLERERAVATARLETERAAIERARTRLGALIGAAPHDAHGTLLPDDPPDPLATLREHGTRRPDLRALDLRGDAARRELAALGHAWLPDLRLEAGWKGVGMPGVGRADGFLANAMLTFQPRNQVRGLRALAEGEARAARGRRALLGMELDGELAGARAEAVGLRDAATAFRKQAISNNADLVRIASVGYEGGELGLLEVLDAYRGSADDALTLLEMEHAARRARVQLDRLTGVGLQ